VWESGFSARLNGPVALGIVLQGPTQREAPDWFESSILIVSACQKSVAKLLQNVI